MKSTPCGTPSNWESAKLDELRAHDAPIIYGILQPGPDSPGGVPYVRPTEIRHDKIVLDSLRRTTPEIAAKYERSKLEPGDVLMSIVGTIGKLAVVPSELDGANITQSSCRIRPNTGGILRRFLLHGLRSPQLVAQYDRDRLGTGVPRLNLSHVRALDFPLPPLNEQRRIVDRIEALQARSTAAKVALDAIPPLLEKFRQSVLAAAFRGDLTAAWRAANPDVEPATALLDRIRAERRVRWIEDAAEKGRARAEKRARKAGKPWTDADDAKALAKARATAEKKYTPPEPVDTEGLPELPEGWCWARLAELTPSDAEIVYGIVQPGPRQTEGVPYIRPADIVAPGVVTDDLPRTTQAIADKYARASLRPGDLVFSIVGTIGKWFIVPAELNGANITQSAVRIRPAKPLGADYLLRCLQSPDTGAQMARMLFGNAVQRLNVSHVRELAVPLVPDGERDEMLTAISRSLQSMEIAATARTDAATRLTSLDQSILAKAFRGELVPQDPDDEPASVLLDRIRAEREAAEAAAKAAKKAARAKKAAAKKRGRA